MSEIQFAERMDQLPPYLFGTINRMKTQKRLNGDDVIDQGPDPKLSPQPHGPAGAWVIAWAIPN